MNGQGKRVTSSLCSSPCRTKNRLRLQDVRIYLRGTNLYTLSRFSGYSPELASQNVLASGIDLGTYPITSVYSLGLNLSF